MTAGIPGSGLGGIFYMLLAVCMPLHELAATFRSRSQPKRWASVLTMVALCAGILGALWGEAWVLTRLSEWCQVSRASIAQALPALAAAPFIVLGVLFVLVHTARLIAGEPGHSGDGSVTASPPSPEGPS